MGSCASGGAGQGPEQNHHVSDADHLTLIRALKQRTNLPAEQTITIVPDDQRVNVVGAALQAGVDMTRYARYVAAGEAEFCKKLVEGAWVCLSEQQIRQLANTYQPSAMAACLALGLMDSFCHLLDRANHASEYVQTAIPYILDKIIEHDHVASWDRWARHISRDKCREICRSRGMAAAVHANRYRVLQRMTTYVADVDIRQMLIGGGRQMLNRTVQQGHHETLAAINHVLTDQDIVNFRQDPQPIIDAANDYRDEVVNWALFHSAWLKRPAEFLMFSKQLPASVHGDYQKNLSEARQRILRHALFQGHNCLGR